MEKHKVVSTEKLEKWLAPKKANLSDELRALKVDELEDELFHLRTLPLRKELSKEDKKLFEIEVNALIKSDEEFEGLATQPYLLKRFKKLVMPKEKFERLADTADFVVGKIGKNKVASGDVRQKIRRTEDVLKKLGDPSHKKYISGKLRKDYQSREMDLCGFLDRGCPHRTCEGRGWTDNQIHTMRKIVGEMATILELANEQGIQVTPIFVGLHRLVLKNCTKGCDKDCTRDHDHKKSRDKRKNAQHNLVVDLFRIRKRSMKIERVNEIPSYRNFLSDKFGINL